MKKIVLIGLSIIAFSGNGISQVHNNSIGLRTSNANFRRGTFLQYQLGLSPKSRLDFGLNGYMYNVKSSSITGGVVQTSLYYQHVWNIKGGLNWYAGAGIKYQFGNAVIGSEDYTNHVFSFGPQVGIEYDFNVHNVPLIFGLDYSPSLSISSLSNSAYFNSSTSLSLRYTFGGLKSESKKK